MNMITPEKDLLKGSEMTANPALKKLMAAWESKQAKNARKAGGLGLVAVSLAACGSSSSSDPDPVDPVDPVPVGQTFTLTTGVDVFTGGDGDDVFNAPLADASGSLQGLLGIQTLGGQDVLTGGEGQDTLNAELNATGTTMNPTITGIEVLNFTVMPLPALGAIVPSFGAIDLHRSEGYEEIWNIDSRYSLSVINVRTDADGNAPTIGLDGVHGGTTFRVTYDTDEAVTDQVVIATDVGSTTNAAILEINTPVIGAGADLDMNYFETLSLDVSNGVHLVLENDAAWMENLVISGSGALTLSGEGDFDRLVSLDSTGYAGDLTLDVSGSASLESVATGAGDDTITINAAAVRGDLEVDLGAGDDNLVLADGPSWWVFDAAEISALDFSGGASGVETLSFSNDVDLDGAATLNLDGFDGDLTTVQFRDFEGNDNSFSLRNAPETLDIEVASDFDDVSLLDTGNVVNLTLTVTGDDFDDEIDIDNVTGGALETLSLVNLSADGDDAQGDIRLDITSDASTDVSSLQSISADGTGDVDVDLDASDADADMDALETIDVVAGGDAELSVNGVAPVQQVQSFTVAAAGGWAGEAVFIIPGVGEVSGNASVLTGLGDLVADLNSDLLGTNYEASLSGNTIVFTKLDGGPADPILLDEVNSGGVIASTFSVVSNGITTPGVDGAGLAGLQEIVVDAGEDADVELTNVYGDFTVTVTAADDAWVDLENTNATELSVTAGDHADIDVTGALHGNPNLVSITVESVTADVTLADDLASFSTLDLTGVETSVTVDAGDADYGFRNQTDVVEYLIGATDTVSITAESAEQAREIFKFTGEDIGDVTISNFDSGNSAVAERDIIDFTAFSNITSATDLHIQAEDGTGFIEITAAGDQFEGSIVLEGIAWTADAAEDLATFNIQYV